MKAPFFPREGGLWVRPFFHEPNLPRSEYGRILPWYANPLRRVSVLTNQSIPDPHLLELAEESTYAYQMTYAHLPGGEGGTTAECSWYRGGLPGEFFNGVLHSRFQTDGLDDKIRATLRPFQERGMPMRWYLGPSSQPTGLEEALQRCGLHFSWSGPAMAINLVDLRRPVVKPDGLEIKRVSDAAGLAAWIDIFLGNAPLEVKKRLTWAYSVTAFGKTLDVRLYLGIQNGKPVATAAMFFGSTAAAIKHVSTLPDYQRRGIATALTLRALDDAIGLGRRFAALTSSTEGYPVYQGLGFQEVCRFTRYVWKPEN